MMIFRPIGYSDKTAQEMQRQVEDISGLIGVLEEFGIVLPKRIESLTISRARPKGPHTRFIVLVALKGIAGFHAVGEIEEIDPAALGNDHK
jgi:hypothetical protein